MLETHGGKLMSIKRKISSILVGIKLSVTGLLDTYLWHSMLAKHCTEFRDRDCGRHETLTSPKKSKR